MKKLDTSYKLWIGFSLLLVAIWLFIVYLINIDYKKRHEIFKENEIENLKNYGSGHTQALNAIDQSISVNLNNISNLDKEISEKKLRISGIRSIISEIQAEVETLSLNESARRVAKINSIKKLSKYKMDSNS